MGLDQCFSVDSFKDWCKRLEVWLKVLVVGGDVWERLWWDVRSERCFVGVDWEVLSEGDVWEVLCGF